MTAITFDTFKFVRRLKEAGIPEIQAEAISDAIQETHANQSEGMATKRDLMELGGQLSSKADVTDMAKMDIRLLEIKQDAKETKAELKRDIKELELRITAEIAPLKWGTAVCVGGIVALILKSFFPH
ncbi:MAG: CCDC90 family protein [Magnetococcus sp. XQGC-1]